MTQDPTILILVIAGISGILLIWNIFLQISLSKIKTNQKILFQGADAKSLEKVVLESQNSIQHLDKDIKDLYEITSKIHNLAHHGIHRVGTLRFNPFRDLGGDQSFSVALLDGNNNGVILSSLYSRDGVRVYAKAINAGQSIKYPLTEEEKEAIRIASMEKNNKTARKPV